MKKERFYGIMALVMTVILAISSTLAVRYIRAYAAEPDDYDDDEYDMGFDWDDPDDIYIDPVLPPTPDPEPQEPTPTPTLAPTEEPDPFDYSLSCYTPNVDFGTVREGEYVNARQFTIVNTGHTRVPLDIFTMDPYTSFGLSTTSSTDLEPGDQVTFTVNPAQNLREGSYFATFTFYSANDIRQHHSVTVRVTINIVKADPYVDRVTISPGSANIPAGKSMQFTAYVHGGNNYDDGVIWSIGGARSRGTDIDNSGRLTVASDESASTLSVTATSRQNTSVYDTIAVSITSYDHMVSVSASPAEGGNVTGGGSVRNGGSARLNQSANNNYRFTGWFENNAQISTASQLDLNNITSDRSIQARFERVTCYVKTGVNDSYGGTVTGGGSVNYGGSLTLTAKANDGYTFEGFVEGNKTISTSSSLQINNITSDRTIIASFRPSRFAVSASVNPVNAGSVEGAGQYSEKTKVTLKAKANKGYDFYGWTMNGQLISTSDTYVIDKINNNYNLVANFNVHNAPTYRIRSGIANQGGGIVPSGDNYVSEGGTVVYHIVPLSGYRILAVAVDGVNVGAVSSYSFTNVQGAHTIAASFAKVETPKQPSNVTPKQETNDNIKPTSTPTLMPVTDYNTETASQGALPEQVIVDDPTLPTDISELPADLQPMPEEYPWDSESEATSVSGGVLGKYGITDEYARMIIDNNSDLPLLKEAFEDGTLQVAVNNSFAEHAQETSVELYYKKPTLHNFEEVIASSLSKEEKMALLKGEPATFNVSLTENNEIVPESLRKKMQSRVGYKALDYFSFVIMKTMDAKSSLVTELDKELEVSIDIPEDCKRAGRTYCVLREHNGVVDVLKDIDEDPDTITFRTDRFSEYAIGYEVINVNVLMAIFVGITLLALIIATVCFVNLINYRRKARLARKAQKMRG